MSDNNFEYKTESELLESKKIIISNLEDLWDNYIFNHIEMLKATSINDEGQITYDDSYVPLRQKCADDIIAFEGLQKELTNINNALNELF